MKRLFLFILLLAAIAFALLPTLALAQTKTVNKTISNNGLTESLVVPTGKTLTIASGATINAATGSTITGFTANAVWGGITGTLSAQTDLQTALDAKASLTGTYSDPAWLTGLAWSKLGSVPAAVTALGTAGLGTGVLTGDGTAYSYLGITTNPRDNADAGKLVKTDVVGNISAKSILSQSDDLANSAYLNGGLIQISNVTGTWNLQPSASSGLFTLSLPGETGTLLTDVSALSLGKLESAGATDTQVLTWSDANSQWEPATVLNLIAAGSIAISKLAITGTPDGTKFLRDDGSWQTVTSGATLGANTFTGLQQFSGTTHAGLRLNNLTTTQRDAIGSPAAGMVIWNTTAARIQAYNGSAWTAGMVRLDGDTMTGTLVLPAGTVSAPSLTFGDSTSGIYRSASGEVALTSGGTQRLRSTSSGVTVTGPLTVGAGVIHDYGSGQLGIGSGSHYAFSSGFSATGLLRVSTSGLGNGNFVQIRPIAANTGLWENGTTAQAIYVANTYTSATSYEAAGIRWSSNVAIFGPVKGSGGGSSRNAQYHTTETGVYWSSGSGSPESVVTAPVGSIYTRTDGGAATTLYIKESGTGNTGWIAK
jgi:hypothetical protein